MAGTPTPPIDGPAAHAPTVANEPSGHASTVASEPSGHASTVATDATVAPAPGPAFRRVSADDYERGRELARGGMGRILAAHDVRHDRPVAIKELLRSSPSAIARFRREALIAARLQHPAIVPIYEAGTWEDGSPFFAMKRVEGESLDRAIARHEALRDRLALLPHVIAVADALAYAHARGVIHRDLKPHNVLVGDYGETVVIDWGLAKDLRAAPEPTPVIADAATVPGDEGSGGGLTVAGSALGTPAYMPPEQARGEEVDARADVYAIGAILYHLLSGIVPYGAASTARELLDRVVNVEPTPFRAFELELPEDLVTIVEKAMARTAKDRYADAGELAAELKRFAAGQMVRAHSYTRRERLARWIEQHRVLVASTLVVLGCAIAGLIVYVRAVGAEREATDRARRAAEEQRVRAEDNLAHARAQTMALLEEEGAARLVAGQPLQAAAYLSHAYAMGDRSVALRFTLARAMPAAESVGVTGRGGMPTAVLLSADGTRVILGERGVVRIHAVDTGEEVATLHGEGDPRVALLGDTGQAVIAWDGDGKVALIDTKHGVAIATKLPATPEVSKVAATPDGKTIFLGTLDGSVRAIGADGAERWTVRAGTTIRALRASPDGAHLGVLDDTSTISVLRTDDGHATATAHGTRFELGPGDVLGYVDVQRGTAKLGRGVALAVDHPVDVAVSPAGDRVATISEAGATIELWDARTGAHLGALVGHTGQVWGIAFDHTGAQLASSGDDRTVRIWDVARRQTTQVLAGLGASAGNLAFSADGAHVLGAGMSGLRVWPLDRSPLAQPIDTSGVRAIAYSPDGKELVIAGNLGVERRVLATGAATVAHDGAADAIGFVGDTLALGAGERAWLVTRPEIAFTGHTGTIRAITPIGDDGVLTGGDDQTLRIWDAATGKQRAMIATKQMVMDATATPDGKTIAVAAGVAFEVWDAATGARRSSTSGSYNCVGISPDGKLVAVGGLDSAIWDTATWTRRATLEEHVGVVLDIGFTPDSAIMVTIGSDGRVLASDPATGRLLAIVGVQPDVYQLAVRADGAEASTFDRDGMIRRWDLHLEDRAPEEISAIVERGVPWRIDEGGRLVAADPR